MDLTLKTFHRKTKKGTVVKIVREHYLRKDISCGWVSCTRCVKEERACLSDDPRVGLSTNHSAHFVIPDSDVILDQIDIFEDDAFGNEVIILQTVLNDVRSRNIKTYSRLRELISTEKRCFYVFCNEYHVDTYVERKEKEEMSKYVDRLMNAAVDWYRNHFKAADFVILSSKPNKDRYPFDEYVRGHVKSQQLLDKLQTVEDASMDVDSIPEKSENIKKKEKEQEPPEKEMRFLYPPHLTTHDILVGIKNGTLYQGKYRANTSCYLQGCVTVISPGGEEMEVLIQGRMNINRAIDQDTVAIELLPESEWVCEADVVLEPGEEVDESALENASMKTQGKARKPSGKVVGIVRRKYRHLTGSIKKREGNISSSIVVTNHLFVPKDNRMPIIRIETRQYDILKDQRIVVAIDSWSRDSKYPRGHYVRALGPIGDFAAERESVLLEFDVPHDSFSRNVLKCLPSDPDNWSIPPEEYKSRLDLRDYYICSVDPPGCTDIDDTLHCRILDSGDWEVGVHIADVGLFVKENSALDVEAAKRGTTVYLQDTRIDMIPGVLSSNLASLKEGVERLTFSCIWIMDKETAEIKKTTFAKSIIKSKAAMTYEQAQAKINSKSTDELTESLRRLNFLAKKLKQKRLDSGALVLASGGEIKFVEVESETHDNLASVSQEIKMKEMLETNSMVEEFMLLANCSVAQRIIDDFPEISVLRKHPQPSANNFEQLRVAAKIKGIEIDVSDGKTLSESLNRAIDESNPFFNTLIRILTTRCMTQARYFCSGVDDTNMTHFGLAANLYTHFTSPIRRYADLMVHRLLAACINANPLDPSLMNKNKVSDICENINIRHKNGQMAQRASQRIHTIAYIKNSGKIIHEEAHVLQFRRNALELFIPALAFQVTYFTRAPDWNEDPETLSQVHTKTGIRIRMFDRLRINIGILDSSNEYQRGREEIEVRIIEPPVDAALISYTRIGKRESAPKQINKKVKR